MAERSNPAMTARPDAPPSPPTPAGQSLAAMPCYASSCGRVTLYLGDCLPLLATVKADAIISDPPYGIAHKSGGGTGGKWHKVKHQGVTIEGDSEPFDPSPLLRTGLPFVLWGANFFSEKLPGSGCRASWISFR